MWRQRWFQAQRSFAHSTPASAAWHSLPACTSYREKVNNDNHSLVSSTMKFSHQIRGTMAQVLGVLSDNAAQIFVYKHFGLTAANSPPLHMIVENAADETVQSMLVELVSTNKALRTKALIKNVFDEAVGELKRWALHDGWIVDGAVLVRVTPLAEEVTGLRDKLTEDLAASGLDQDGSIRAALDDSSKDFVAEPPDFNGSITKARIALETVARKAAGRIAVKRAVAYSEDSWGRALALLKSQSVIEQGEEDILARVYTFVSPGAHVPKGITAEEWARLARTISVSSTYFLLRKAVAAQDA